MASTPHPLGFEFSHIHIYCSDVEASERWFVDGLGAEVVERGDSRGAPSISLRLGGAPITLRAAREDERLAPPGPRAFGTDHFGMMVPDLDVAAAELERRGVEFEVEPFLFRPGRRIAFVRGPDGVRVELQQDC